MQQEKQNDSIVLFKTDDEKIKLDVLFESETVWLTQEQMAVLFEKGRSTVAEHIANVFEEGELEQNRTCRKFRQVRTEGSRKVEREIDYYNLDVIISVGYRVKSLRGTQFRQWATQRLREYIIKGFTMDDERLKELGGGNYWKELFIRLYKLLQEQKEFVLAKQLLRSGTSIGANINEALSGLSKADFAYKMSISSKEARETPYWLELLDKSQMVQFDFKPYIVKCDELVKMLTSIVKTTQNSTLKTQN